MKKGILVFTIGAAVIVFLLIFSFICPRYRITILTNTAATNVHDYIYRTGNYCVSSEILNKYLWEELWILAPYTQAEQLKKQLPFRVKRRIKNTGIRYRDDICILVFLLNNGDYQISIEDRYPVDFVCGSSERIATITPEMLICFVPSEDSEQALVFDRAFQR